MKILREQDVLRVMREEWDRGVKSLLEQVSITMDSKVDDETMPVLSPELKVKHKKSRILYTVSSVGPRDVILRTPEGEQFLVDKERFESEYVLD